MVYAASHPSSIIYHHYWRQVTCGTTKSVRSSSSQVIVTAKKKEVITVVVVVVVVFASIDTCSSSSSSLDHSYPGRRRRRRRLSRMKMRTNANHVQVRGGPWTILIGGSNGVKSRDPSRRILPKGFDPRTIRSDLSLLPSTRTVCWMLEPTHTLGHFLEISISLPMLHGNDHSLED